MPERTPRFDTRSTRALRTVNFDPGQRPSLVVHDHALTSGDELTGERERFRPVIFHIDGRDRSLVRRAPDRCGSDPRPWSRRCRRLRAAEAAFWAHLPCEKDASIAAPGGPRGRETVHCPSQRVSERDVEPVPWRAARRQRFVDAAVRLLARPLHDHHDGGLLGHLESGRFPAFQPGRGQECTDVAACGNTQQPVLPRLTSGARLDVVAGASATVVVPEMATLGVPVNCTPPMTLTGTASF